MSVFRAASNGVHACVPCEMCVEHALCVSTQIFGLGSLTFLHCVFMLVVRPTGSFDELSALFELGTITAETVMLVFLALEHTNVWSVPVIGLIMISLIIVGCNMSLKMQGILADRLAPVVALLDAVFSRLRCYRSMMRWRHNRSHQLLVIYCSNHAAAIPTLHGILYLQKGDYQDCSRAIPTQGP